MRQNLVICILILICFTGCKQSASIEEKNYVLVLGIDRAKGGEKQLAVSYSKADISKLQGQEGDIEDSQIVTYEVDTLAEAEKQDEADDAKQLSLGHLKAILVGKEVLQEKKLYQKVVDEIQKNHDIAKTVLVYESKPSAKKVMSLEKELSGTLGEYIEQLSKKQKQMNAEEEVTLNEVILAENTPGKECELPLLERKNKKIHFSSSSSKNHQ